MPAGRSAGPQPQPRPPSLSTVPALAPCASLTPLPPPQVGDYVDVKVNAAVHNGMPFKFYHGKTGVVWNVTKRALGVELNKVVGTRQLKKRIHVRVEHVQPSRCREDFLRRREANDVAKKEAKARGEKLSTKRVQKGPRAGYILENVKAQARARKLRRGGGCCWLVAAPAAVCMHAHAPLLPRAQIITPVPYDIVREGVKA